MDIKVVTGIVVGLVIGLNYTADLIVYLPVLSVVALILVLKIAHR